MERVGEEIHVAGSVTTAFGVGAAAQHWAREPTIGYSNLKSQTGAYPTDKQLRQRAERKADQSCRQQEDEQTTANVSTVDLLVNFGRNSSQLPLMAGQSVRSNTSVNRWQVMVLEIAALEQK